MDKWITKIGDIIQDPHKYAGQDNLILKGKNRGWSHEEGPAVKYGPPVTKSDWILKDDTGEIYIQGSVLLHPKHLHPADDLDVEVLLSGQVVMSDADPQFPFISIPNGAAPSMKTIKGKMRFIKMREEAWVLSGIDLNDYQLIGEGEDLHQPGVKVEVKGYLRPDFDSIMKEEITVMQVIDYKIEAEE